MGSVIAERASKMERFIYRATEAAMTRDCAWHQLLKIVIAEGPHRGAYIRLYWHNEEYETAMVVTLNEKMQANGQVVAVAAEDEQLIATQMFVCEMLTETDWKKLEEAAKDFMAFGRIREASLNRLQ